MNIDGISRRSAAVLLSVILCAHVSYAQLTRIYRNTIYGYKLEYPDDFKLKIMGSASVFSSDIADKTFAFSPSVNVVAVDLGVLPDDLETFYAKSKDALRGSLGNINIIEDKKDKLAGVAAYRLVYTSKQKKADFKFLQIISVRGNKAYVLTYTALQEQYDKMLRTAQAIIKSFEFIEEKTGGKK